MSPSREDDTITAAERSSQGAALINAILPRFLLLVGWTNDQAYWGSLFGSSFWLAGGILVLPWTTLVYGFAKPNGLTLLDLIFLVCGLLLDPVHLGTRGTRRTQARRGLPLGVAGLGYQDHRCLLPRGPPRPSTGDGVTRIIDVERIR